MHDEKAAERGQMDDKQCLQMVLDSYWYRLSCRHTIAFLSAMTVLIDHWKQFFSCFAWRIHHIDNHTIYLLCLLLPLTEKYGPTTKKKSLFQPRGWLQTWMYRVILLSIGITVPTFKNATGWLNNFYTHFWQHTLHYTYLALSARDEAIYDNNMYTATLCTIERCHWFVAIISRPKKALSNWRGRESSQLNARMSRIRRIRPLAMGAEGQPLALWGAHKSRVCCSVTFHTQILMHDKVSMNQYSLSYSAQLWHHNSKHLHSHIHIVIHNVSQ